MLSLSLLTSRIWLTIWVICLLLFTVRPASSESNDFSRWLAGLKRQALAEGISEKTLNTTLAEVRPNEFVLKLDRNQPEFKLTFDEYLHRVMPPVRIRIGREKLHKNIELLSKVAERFKVQPVFWWPCGGLKLISEE